jgi:hypothetical protein
LGTLENTVDASMGFGDTWDDESSPLANLDDGGLGFHLFMTPFVFGGLSNTDPAAWTPAATAAWVGGLLLLLFSAESWGPHERSLSERIGG